MSRSARIFGAPSLPFGWNVIPARSALLHVSTGQHVGGTHTHRCVSTADLIEPIQCSRSAALAIISSHMVRPISSTFGSISLFAPPVQLRKENEPVLDCMLAHRAVPADIMPTDLDDFVLPLGQMSK